MTAIFNLSNHAQVENHIIGSNGYDFGNAIVVDSLGYVYITGTTGAPAGFAPGSRFFGTPGNNDVFISKYDNTFIRHIKTVFIGSSLDDKGLSLALSNDGKTLYISGTTKNPADFGPSRVIVGNTGDKDVFIARLDAGLDSLYQITILASPGKDEGHEVAVGYDGSVFLTGQAGNDNFICTSCPQKIEYGDSDGNVEAFVSRLTPDLVHLKTTLLTSDAEDEAYAIAFDHNHYVYIAGRTKNYDDFACNKEYYGGQPLFKVGYSAFVARLTYDLQCRKTGILASDIVSDVIRDVVIDDQGYVYVGGLTESPGTFPKSPKYYHGTTGGTADGFIVKLNNSLNNHIATAMLSSMDKDKVYSLSLDGNGHIVAAGYTMNRGNFGDNRTIMGNTGDEDVFIAMLDNSLASMVKTYIIGSNQTDICYSVFVDAKGHIHATGETADWQTYGDDRVVTGTTGGSREIFITTVRATNPAGLCHTPQPIYTSRITPASARLNWAAPSSATRVEIRGKPLANASWRYLHALPAPPYRQVNGLQNQVTYIWQIRSLCDGWADTSAWSPPDTFTAKCQPPDTLWADPVTATSARLHWDRTPGAAGYEIKGQKAGGNWITLPVNNGLTTTKDVYGLTPSTTYRWKVRAWCDPQGNATSSFTPVDIFTTAALRQAGGVFRTTPALADIAYHRDKRLITIHLRQQHEPSGQVWMYDIAGKVVFHDWILRHRLAIPVDGLPAGMYLVRIANADQSVVKRIVVE